MPNDFNLAPVRRADKVGNKKLKETQQAIQRQNDARNKKDAADWAKLDAAMEANREPYDAIRNQGGLHEELKNKVRIEDQDLLMMDWRKLSEINSARATSYDNFISIDSPDPSTMVSELFSKGDSDILFNMTSADLSQLVPEIRIYKVYPDKDNLKIIRKTIEIPFDTHIHHQDISQITATKAGRGRGVGIKSFSWSSEGSDKHLGNFFIYKASLKLYLQSIEELFAPIVTAELDDRGNQVQVRLTDLFTQSRTYLAEGKEDYSSSRVYNEQYFRIKAVVGWYIPKNVKFESFKKKSNIDALRTALEKTQTMLELSIVNHEIDFQDDGSAFLTLNYVASAEAAAKDPTESNIFFVSPELKRKQERLMETQKLLLKKQSDIADSGKVNKSEAKKTEAQLKENDDMLAVYEENKKALVYQRMITSLMAKGAVRYRQWDKQALIELDNSLTRPNPERTMTLLRKATATVKTINANKRRDPRYKPPSTNEVQPSFTQRLFGAAYERLRIEDFWEEAAELVTGKLRGPSEEFDFKAEDLARQIAESKLYGVPYFFLGDLIDVVLDGMYEKPIDKTAQSSTAALNKSLRVVLGSVTFRDYGNFEDTGVKSKLTGAPNPKTQDKLHTGQTYSIPIANIPIAFDSYTHWFTQEYLQSAPTHCSFGKFIDDVIRDLVFKAASRNSSFFTPRQQGVRMSYKSFSLPNSQPRDDMLIKHIQRDPSAGLYINQGSEGLNSRVSLFSHDGDVKTTDYNLNNYLFIYGMGETRSARKGDYHEDKEKGIYHLYFGNELGLTKRIKFKREDIPHLRAANIMNSAYERGSPEYLQEKYNASVEMFGNNLFEVGSPVHITPTFPGSSIQGVSTQQIFALGLGGYFTILGINNNIEAGIYSTELDTKWDAPGDGTNSQGDDDNTPASNVATTKPILEPK